MHRSKLSGAPDVAVVGGGLIGLAAARALAREGMQVVVLEAGEPARQASWAGAGMLAPLAETPVPGPFFAACRRSRDLWRSYAAELEEESGIDLDYDASGTIALPDAPGHLAALAAAAASLGEPWEKMDGAAAAALMPGLSPAIGEALQLPGEHRVDNRAAGAALLTALERRAVPVRSGWPVAAIEARPGGVVLRRADGEALPAGAAVVAAGAWSGRIAGLPPIPVLPVHGQMLALAEVLWPFQGCVRGAHFYTVRRAGGRLLVGATAEEIGFAEWPTPAGIAALTGWLAATFPGLANRPLTEIWSGLRPATADRLPLLGELERNVWVATAHFRNGILLAPWTAERLADLVQGRPPATEDDRRALELFAPRGARLAPS